MKLLFDRCTDFIGNKHSFEILLKQFIKIIANKSSMPRTIDVVSS